jgi:predicted RNA-binding Zn-ribbon protein involved in translation (DUF1610 family)
MTRQPEQQQQRSLAHAYPCPSCRQDMRLVGRESAERKRAADVLTFQCYACGQIITRHDAQRLP